MIKSCAVCQRSFEARRSTAKYCGSSCRARASQSPDNVLKMPQSLLAGAVYDSTLAQMDAAGRSGTPLGQAALVAAMRVDNLGAGETGSGVAALLKAHRESLAEALKGAQVEQNPVEMIRQSAALKLLKGVG